MAASGATVNRGEVEYTIEASAITISLTSVAIYCTHTRTQTLEIGTISLNGASAVPISTS